MAAVVALAKVDKFTEGMEPTAIPFASLAQGWANKTSKSPS